MSESRTKVSCTVILSDIPKRTERDSSLCITLRSHSLCEHDKVVQHIQQSIASSPLPPLSPPSRSHPLTIISTTIHQPPSTPHGPPKPTSPAPSSPLSAPSPHQQQANQQRHDLAPLRRPVRPTRKRHGIRTQRGASMRSHARDEEREAGPRCRNRSLRRPRSRREPFHHRRDAVPGVRIGSAGHERRGQWRRRRERGWEGLGGSACGLGRLQERGDRRPRCPRAMGVVGAAIRGTSADAVSLGRLCLCLCRSLSVGAGVYGRWGGGFCARG